jgi:hypothetical protein
MRAPRCRLMRAPRGRLRRAPGGRLMRAASDRNVTLLPLNVRSVTLLSSRGRAHG